MQQRHPSLSAGNPDVHPLQGKQLPLALKVRQGKTFANFASAADSPLLALLDALSRGEAGQACLHGAAGTGKSHLLEAAVTQAETLGRTACLLAAGSLAGLSPALLEGMDGFSLVAIDDVDALAGHSDWEEALFHLYNRVREAQGSLLFAARLPPRQTGFRLPDLLTRLGAGPVLAVELPDDESLKRLIRRQASARGLEMGEALASYLVTHAPRQPAALERLLEQLDQAALAESRRLTIPFVRQQLGW